MGCQGGPSAPLLPPTASLAEDLQPLAPDARVARMQVADRPPPPPGVKPASLPGPLDAGTSARAYVNSKPIFDYEIMNQVPQSIGRIKAVKGMRPEEVQARILDQAREDLIDQEVVYQEAVRKLEKGNPKVLAKLREIAEQETDRVIDESLRKRKITPEQLKEQLPGLKRHMERGLISSEFLRSRTLQWAKSRVGFQEIRDYYEAHKNEYERPESVEWQDIFIAVGPKYPTLADARRAGEELIARVRTSTTEEFARLLPFDDGDSKLRGGLGYGKRRGEIKPAELEEYLFKMRDGEIGPIVEFTSGVHIFRVIKRDLGGLMPLDEKLQREINDKLVDQVIRREQDRIIRELRNRSDIVYVNEG